MTAKNKICSWYFVLLFVAISVLPFIVNAQSLILKTPKAIYHVGDSFQVSLSVDTSGQAINTISGKVVVPVSLFELRDVRYGTSIVSLWVEKPRTDFTNGFVYFTGGIPGGFNGSAGPLLSFGLKAKKSGIAEVLIADVNILLNDGLGTELKNIKISPLRLAITEALPPPVIKPVPAKEVPIVPPVEVYIPSPDTVPPEDFVPLVSRHPSIGNNNYFVSFSTADKDTGVSYYEIREKPRILTRITTKFDTRPVRSETPYILKGQYWAYDVLVRACDQAGNCKEASAEKPFHPAVLWAGVAALVAGAVLITRYVFRPRRHIRRVV